MASNTDKPQLPPSRSETYILWALWGAAIVVLATAGLQRVGFELPETPAYRIGYTFSQWVLATGEPAVRFLLNKGIIKEYNIRTSLLWSLVYFAVFGAVAGMAACFVFRWFTPRKVVVDEEQ